MSARPIDPACEPYRHIIEAFRRDLADIEGGQYTPPPESDDDAPRAPVARLAPEVVPAAGMTPQQSAALAFIKQYIAEHHYSPSYVEIAAALGLRSKRGIHRTGQGLATRGRIRVMRSEERRVGKGGVRKV